VHVLPCPFALDARERTYTKSAASYRQLPWRGAVGRCYRRHAGDNRTDQSQNFKKVLKSWPMPSSSFGASSLCLHIQHRPAFSKALYCACRHAQRTLAGARKLAELELDNCERVATIFEAQYSGTELQPLRRRTQTGEPIEVQKLRAKVVTVRKSLWAAAPVTTIYHGSGLDRAAGDGGSLCTTLHAVQSRIDAAVAEAKAGAEVFNEGTCFALRVMAMAVVRESLLPHLTLHQLGRDRRVCKDWHRWNGEAMRARIPAIPCYVVAGRLGARVEYRAIGDGVKGCHEAPECIADKIAQIQHSHRGAFSSFWDARRERMFFAGYRDTPTAEENTFIVLDLKTGVWSELPSLVISGRIIAGCVMPDDGRLLLLTSVGTVPSLSESRWHCFDQISESWSVLATPRLLELEDDPSFFGPQFLGMDGSRLAIFTNDYSAPVRADTVSPCWSCRC
jgi:hypothetical protein